MIDVGIAYRWAKFRKYSLRIIDGESMCKCLEIATGRNRDEGPVPC